MTSMIWQLSMGQQDYNLFMNFIQMMDINGGIFKYEKGRANMVVVPKIGDEVWITSCAKLLAKAIIIDEFHYDHVWGRDVATMLVNEIIYDQPYMKGMRRNWTQCK